MASTRERQKNDERKAKARSWADRQKNLGGGGSRAVRLPDGCEWFKPEASDKPIDVDIMPYRVGKGNPACDEGEVYCDREFTVHKIPTPNSQWGEPHACLWENFRKPCPVCKHQQKVGDQDLAKQLRGQVRHLFIINTTPGKTKFTPKIFDIHHFQRGEGFPEKLTDAINVDPDKYGTFYDLEEGFTVRLTIKDQPMGDGSKRPGIVRIDFVPRDYTYPESVLDKMPCLDEMIIEEDPRQLADLLEGGVERNGKPKDKDDDRAPSKARAQHVDDDEDDDDDSDLADEDDDDDDEPAAKKGKKKATDDDDGDENPHAVGLKIGDMVTYKGEPHEIITIGPKGLTLEDDDGNEIKGVPPGKVTSAKAKKASIKDDEDEEDERPTKKRKAPVDEDDDEDQDDEDGSALEDEDDDDEPAAKKSSKKRPAIDEDDEDEVQDDDDD